MHEILTTAFICAKMGVYVVGLIIFDGSIDLKSGFEVKAENFRP